MTPIKHNRPFIFHFRPRVPMDGKSVVSGKGGVTIVYLPDSQRWGASVCSQRDSFNRKLGRKIAEGRAACIVAQSRYACMDGFDIGGSCKSVEDVFQVARDLAHNLADYHKIALTN